MGSDFKFLYAMQWLSWFDDFVLDISVIALITVKGVNYHCIIHDITKSEAIVLQKDSMLEYHGYL